MSHGGESNCYSLIFSSLEHPYLVFTPVRQAFVPYRLAARLWAFFLLPGHEHGQPE
jgi:hypothetical protein